MDFGHLSSTSQLGTLLGVSVSLGHCPNGADVNAEDNDSDIPLHDACYRSHINIVKLLLQKDVDLVAWDKVLKSALCHASEQGHLELVKLLLEKGADLHAHNKDLCTALDLARNGGHNEIVAALTVASSALVTPDL
ncbi:hypothetical protein PAXINDRAFT_16612 [Paxillus involutus ATCC 200175]|uniref:Ankyrin n=1 Tax=Paxillus involutus ATCC 200175 TaxID=664439 RepID=A0A0C9T417_PAXIN|nr:hypothetical protein PAXINDRAFT_16612 [Paxillus involutus ATCC 200175]